MDQVDGSRGRPAYIFLISGIVARRVNEVEVRSHRKVRDVVWLKIRCPAHSPVARIGLGLATALLDAQQNVSLINLIIELDTTFLDKEIRHNPVDLRLTRSLSWDSWIVGRRRG